MIDEILSGGGVFAWLLALTIALCVTMIVASVLNSSFVRLQLSAEQKIWAFILGFAFLCSLASAPLVSVRSWSVQLFYYAVPPLCALLYFLPTAVATAWHHPEFEGIFLLNLVFGWTVIGWMAALVWAVRGATSDSASSQEHLTARMTPGQGKPDSP